MGCIVSKLFLDFYIFFIFTRPPTHMRPTCSPCALLYPFSVLMRALTSNHTLIKRGLDRGQIEVVLKIFQICRHVNLKIYNSNEQETTE